MVIVVLVIVLVVVVVAGVAIVVRVEAGAVVGRDRVSPRRSLGLHRHTSGGLPAKMEPLYAKWTHQRSAATQ